MEQTLFVAILVPTTVVMMDFYNPCYRPTSFLCSLILSMFHYWLISNCEWLLFSLLILFGKSKDRSVGIRSMWNMIYYFKNRRRIAFSSSSAHHAYTSQTRIDMSARCLDRLKDLVDAQGSAVIGAGLHRLHWNRKRCSGFLRAFHACRQFSQSVEVHLVHAFGTWKSRVISLAGDGTLVH